MGIDPMTHKPNGAAGSSKYVANLSHMAEWESARLEAEARLVQKSKILFNNNNNSHNYNINPTTISQQLPYYQQLPCLDILKAWQMTSTKLPTINDISHAILRNNSKNKKLDSSIPSSTLNSSENIFANNAPTTTKVGDDHQNLHDLSTINSCFEDDHLQTELPSFMQEFSGVFPEYTQNSTNGLQVDNIMGSFYGDFEDNKLINWNNFPNYLVNSPIGSPVF